MITIRHADAADAKLIAEMSRRTFYDTFAAANTVDNMKKFMSNVFTMEALEKEVGSPGSTFLLAYDGDIPVGYARLREGNNPENMTNAIEIARIYAETAAIGKGVGKSLMEKCLAIGREKGYQFIWLGVWEHNTRAIGFYQKWGFEKFSQHSFTLGDDVQTDWLMKKSL